MSFDDPNLEQYATESQLKALKAYQKHKSLRKAAKELGITHSVLQRKLQAIKERAKKSGYMPENGLTEPFDASLMHTKSTVHVKDGQVIQYWARLSPDAELQEQLRKKALLDFVADLPKVKPVKFNKHPQELMACYPLGDPHIGMLSWGEETGNDWDLNIATKVFSGAFKRLVESVPSCEKAVIFNLGDFFHSDNIRGMTERSGHVLDMDGRYAKMKRVGYKIMRMMIEYSLEHHESVHVVNSIGNHDDTGAMDMSIALAEIYADEKRLTVDISPTPCHYVRYGSVLIGSHHGHTIKAPNLPLVMATDMANDWGDTEHRYWYTGHIHHDTLKEYPGCKVESFRTLAAKDSYAAWHGYRAGQDSKAIVIHKDHGEIERHTVNIGMVKDL